MNKILNIIVTFLFSIRHVHRWKSYIELEITGNRIIKKHAAVTYHYCDNKLHRIDGPAIIYKSGTKEWWLSGEFQKRTYKPQYTSRLKK